MFLEDDSLLRPRGQIPCAMYRDRWPQAKWPEELNMGNFYHLRQKIYLWWIQDTGYAISVIPVLSYYISNIYTVHIIRFPQILAKLTKRDSERNCCRCSKLKPSLCALRPSCCGVCGKKDRYRTIKTPETFKVATNKIQTFKPLSFPVFPCFSRSTDIERLFDSFISPCHHVTIGLLRFLRGCSMGHPVCHKRQSLSVLLRTSRHFSFRLRVGTTQV